MGFAANPNRINVALTRAKRCLIIVGDVSTLSTSTTWTLLIDYIRKNGKEIDSKSLGFGPSHQCPSFDVTRGRYLTATLSLSNSVNKKIGAVIGAREGPRGRIFKSI